jgi:hypothetical protein
MSEVGDVLKVLFAEGKVTLPSTQKEVMIKKVTLRTMKPVMEFIAEVFEELQLTGDNLPSVNLQSPTLILKLISKHFEKIISLSSKLCSLSEDELLDLDTDESVLVIQAIIALNQDFFTTKVLPSLRLLRTDEQS